MPFSNHIARMPCLSKIWSLSLSTILFNFIVVEIIEIKGNNLAMFFCLNFMQKVLIWLKINLVLLALLELCFTRFHPASWMAFAQSWVTKINYLTMLTQKTIVCTWNGKCSKIDSSYTCGSKAYFQKKFFLKFVVFVLFLFTFFFST